MSRENDLRKKAVEAFGLSYLDQFTLYGAYRVVRRKIWPVVIPAIKGFFTDETVFLRGARALIAYLALQLDRGTIPYLDGENSWWAAPIILALAFMFGAGDKTPANVKELSDRMPAKLPEGRIPVVPASESEEGSTTPTGI